MWMQNINPKLKDFSALQNFLEEDMYALVGERADFMIII